MKFEKVLFRRLLIFQRLKFRVWNRHGRALIDSLIFDLLFLPVCLWTYDRRKDSDFQELSNQNYLAVLSSLPVVHWGLNQNTQALSLRGPRSRPANVYGYWKSVVWRMPRWWASMNCLIAWNVSWSSFAVYNVLASFYWKRLIVCVHTEDTVSLYFSDWKSCENCSTKIFLLASAYESIHTDFELRTDSSVQTPHMAAAVLMCVLVAVFT